MLLVIVATAVCAVIAGLVYVGRERLGVVGVGLTALRTLGVAALVLLLINPGSVTRAPSGAPIVLLDASLSMAAAGGHWSGALDTAFAIAGETGTILRFGQRVQPFDTTPATQGASKLLEGLQVARALGGPTYVVTDGEVEDIDAIAPSLVDGVKEILLPRDTLQNVALVDVVVPPHLLREDSLEIVAHLMVWGASDSVAVELRVAEGERVLLHQRVSVPSRTTTVRRRLIVPPEALSIGTHVLRMSLTTDQDAEAADNHRLRQVNVSEQPGVAVLVDPSDWEGRFLVSELSEIAETSIRGYARIASDRWVDMRTLRPVGADQVRRAARQAGLLIIRGGIDLAADAGPRQPLWLWPAAADTVAEFFAGDWYASSAMPASPVAGQLATVPWDSVPPFTGMVPLVPGPDGWVGMTARQGRRGAERPVLIGRDSAGVRKLTMAGAGAWRWRFRGGAAREAYRAVIAAGTDWLLGSRAATRDTALTASAVVKRGEPVHFSWSRDSLPDSLVVTLVEQLTADTTTAILRFDPDGSALHELPPGTYQWRAAAVAARGLTVVEEYSDEFHLRAVSTVGTQETAGGRLVERYARDRWWLFVVVLVALAGEWAWRYRRGLP